LTSKIHAVVDANSLLVRLALTVGEADDKQLGNKSPVKYFQGVEREG
jgi:hypothetical protein